MNIMGFSTNGLLMMHSSIKQALSVDDNMPEGTDKPYGVRSYPDWHEISTEIEAELTNRQVKYERVAW